MYVVIWLIVIGWRMNEQTECLKTSVILAILDILAICLVHIESPGATSKKTCLV